MVKLNEQINVRNTLFGKVYFKLQNHYRYIVTENVTHYVKIDCLFYTKCISVISNIDYFAIYKLGIIQVLYSKNSGALNGFVP